MKINIKKINNIIENLKIYQLFNVNSIDYSIFIVGGFIRDIIFLNSINKDIDIVVYIKNNQNIDYIFKKFVNKFYMFKQFKKFVKFYSIIFLYKNYSININFARKELFKNNKIHYFFNNIKLIDDFLRRDFFCNAIYYNLKKKKILLHSNINKVIKIININSFYIDISRFFRYIELLLKGFIIDNSFFSQNFKFLFCNYLIDKEIKIRIHNIILKYNYNSDFLIYFFLIIKKININNNKIITLPNRFDFFSFYKDITLIQFIKNFLKKSLLYYLF